MNMVKHKRDNPDTLTAKRADELKALANKTDDEIDYSDISRHRRRTVVRCRTR
ncbi:Uncharacterised protein [Klebsiella michiganensis]|nr:Uncharacterised protein [Klebsiella michiganensis]